MKVELFVRLIIPDTIAITALNAMKKMGFEVKSVVRQDYYSFEITENKDFEERIKKVDVLVNYNKHRAANRLEKYGNVNVLVKNTDDQNEGLLNVLRNRLGFNEIKSIVKGTLWSLSIDAGDPLAIAEKITNDLLYNKHYQEIEVL